jgi:hypothetical protein
MLARYRLNRCRYNRGRLYLSCSRVYGINMKQPLYAYIYIYIYIYRMSQEECARLRESVPYVNKVHRYIPKHVYPKLNGYGDNGRTSLKL